MSKKAPTLRPRRARTGLRPFALLPVLALAWAIPTAKAPAQQSGTPLPESWIEHLDWRSVGPANMGGRCTSIAVHPTDAATYWIGTATGGVLKTTNHGVTYTHQFTSETTSSIGDIAVSASNPDILYAGTGESNPRNSVSWGHGVFKSEDGGDTWTNVGLEDSFQIGAIEIHPTDPNTVYAGTLGRLWGDSEMRGLYKTTDGGDNWERVLSIDDKTGIIDMQVDPQDPDTLIVASYERQRDEFDTNDPAKKWGAGSGLWKSTDAGATWKKLTEGLPSGILGRIGLDYSLSEPGVIYAVVESDRITQEPEDAAYFGARGESADVGAQLTSIEEDSPAAEAGFEEGDIIILVDGKPVHSWNDFQAATRKHLAGETVAFVASRDRESFETDVTFSRRPSETEDSEQDEEEGEGEADEAEDDSPPPPGPFHLGLGGQVANAQNQQGPDGHEYGGLYRSEDNGDTWTRVNSVNPRPMYYSRVKVDPSDGDRIYILGTQLHRSKDRGETFTSDGHGNEVHVDHHAMWIDPNDGEHIILGNDGGIYVTWDRMDNWDHHNHMAMGQFYQVETDATRNYKVYGGLQDNGSWGGPNRVPNNRGPVNSDWFNIGGGDGFVVRVDPNDPNQLYGESQNGWTFRNNLETGEYSSIRARAPRGSQYRFNWNTPFILSPHNSRIYFSAGNHVFRSFDRGNGLKAISPEITRTDRGAATALHQSAVDAGVIYVGTDDGAMWMTRDHGANWTDLFASPEAEVEPTEAETETEEAPSAEDVATDLATGAEESEAEESAPSSPLNGNWDGTISGEEIPEGQGGFSMDLKVDDEGKVSGVIGTDFGDMKISRGSFDAETNKMRIRFSNEAMEAIITGTLKGDEISGEIDAGPGMMTLDLAASRDTTVPVTATVGVGVVVEIDPSETPARDTARRGGGQRGARDSSSGQGRGERQDPDRQGYEWAPLSEVAPGRFHVSSIAASQHKAGRVYVTFDGHRSNDDLPHPMLSEDYGATWRSLRGNLPDSAGSTRVIIEDFENEDLLFLGTEFGAWASIDRGANWVRINNGDLPTVPIHDMKLHPLTDELIAGTHGRSVWITDVSTLRQISGDTMSADATLYAPTEAVTGGRRMQAGSSGTRRFVGENPTTGTAIRYSLGKRARSARVWVTDLRGEIVKEFDTSTTRGMHEVRWDLRRDPEPGSNRRWSRPIAPGQYLINLRVDGVTQSEVLEVMSQADWNSDR